MYVHTHTHTHTDTHTHAHSCVLKKADDWSKPHRQIV